MNRYTNTTSKSTDEKLARRYRRLIDNISRYELSGAQRDVLRVLFDLYWKNRNDDGCLSADRDLIAEKADCSRKTVGNAIRRFKSEGVLIARKYANGGVNPAVYAFDPEKLVLVYSRQSKKLEAGK